MIVELVGKRERGIQGEEEEGKTRYWGMNTIKIYYTCVCKCHNEGYYCV